MRYLLDTHTLLWYLDDSPNLSEVEGDIIDSPKNEIFVSMASIWEVAIKISLKKPSFVFDGGTKKLVELINQNHFILLNITPYHIAELEKLPFHHKDPFDRIIIATAIAQNWPLLSKDHRFASYPVKTLW
jgi:PIN domain nuclease of toxin-antitoxin system